MSYTIEQVRQKLGDHWCALDPKNNPNIYWAEANNKMLNTPKKIYRSKSALMCALNWWLDKDNVKILIDTGEIIIHKKQIGVN